VVWTNRFPVEFLEGLEDLIQDPHKMLDEVNGRRFEAELPLNDSRGKRIGALGVVFNYRPGEDKEALVRILVEPKNALVKQYRKFFEFDGVELEFSDDALEAIADQAILRGTGARGLRAIMEEVLLSVMYEVPSRDDVARVVITREAVLENVNPTIVRRETPKRERREKSA